MKLIMAWLTAVGIVVLQLAAPARAVWPDERWQAASPESQGLSSASVEAAATYAQQYGGGSGCIIRHGYRFQENVFPRRD